MTASQQEPPRQSYPVTDPYLDAPDGARVRFENGYVYERHADTWELASQQEPGDPDVLHRNYASAVAELRGDVKRLESALHQAEEALREAMALLNVADVFVLAATPQHKRDDFLTRLDALEAHLSTKDTKPPRVIIRDESPTFQPDSLPVEDTKPQ